MMNINTKMPKFGLLSGYRVIMMGASVAAPFAGELYAENGADVIWLEHPTNVDSSRAARKSGAWQQDRRNMRSLAMNYTKDEGKEVFLKLIETTDVLIEASIGGRYEKMGLGDEILWQRNPKLVIAHISGFGQTGIPEYVGRASYDPIAQAFGCVMRMNGLPGQPSAPAMPFPADFTASFYAYGMTLAALLKRNETGKGESFDIAQYELMMHLQANYPTDYLRYGRDYIKEGNHSRICASYGTYSWLLASNGVPCSRLMSYEEAVTHPHYQAREVFTTWTAADGITPIPGVNIVPKIKNYPGQIWRGAPNIGMDNEDILEELGIPRKQ
ncbi:MAG: crotonobetainyl-CoA--carnitine CoA-transferase [Peptococcaceae bacterium]|nr:crotonobetainyl-CoA--carnitine CoA-transferase [Peptococcaceae bacterium]